MAVGNIAQLGLHFTIAFGYKQFANICMRLVVIGR